MEGGRHEGKDAGLGGERHGQRFRYLERKPGKPSPDGLEEEEDEQGRRVGQGETHVENLERIVQQDDEGAERQRVEEMNVLPQKLPGEIEPGHQHGPGDGGLAFDEKSVEDEQDNQEGRCRAPGDSGKPQGAEEQGGDNPDVRARDGQQVQEPRFLEGAVDVVADPPPFAEEKGLQHRAFRKDASGRLWGGERGFQAAEEAAS